MSTPTTRPTIVTPTMNPALDITTDTEWVLPTGKPRCRAPRYDPGGGRTAGLFFAATVIYLPALLSIFGTAAEDVPCSVELRWRPGEHQAALTSSLCTTGPTGSVNSRSRATRSVGRCK